MGSNHSARDGSNRGAPALGTHLSGRERIEAAPSSAEGILAHELTPRGWAAGEFSNRRKVR